MKKRLSDFEIKVYKMCSSDFFGRTQTEAAEILNVSQQYVSQVLADIMRKCPSLIPIQPPKIKLTTVHFNESQHSNEIRERF